MACYLMNKSDWNNNDDDINKALARIAIKRLINKEDNSAFMFLSEKEIYGLNKLAEEVNMNEILEAKLNESNKLTMKNIKLFKTADPKSYSDSKISQYKRTLTSEYFESFTEYAKYIAKEFKFKISKIYEQEEMIDVEGDVDLYDNKLIKLPIKFNNVSSHFSCSSNQLISLEGAPKYVGGDFNCSGNQLISLEGCPTTVNGDFKCSGNHQLISLKGCPKYVGGNFNCSGNQLISLEGCPMTVNGYFDCNGNKLTSLQGSPSTVKGDFYCSNNKFKSLKGCPEYIKGNWIINDKFKSLPEYQSYLKNEGYTNK